MPVNRLVGLGDQNLYPSTSDAPGKTGGERPQKMRPLHAAFWAAAKKTAQIAQ